jgi:hypothetical protein
MSIEQLKPFIDSDDKYVATVAADLAQIDDDFRSGAINEKMYKELVTDALELAKVRAEASSLDTKIKIEKVADIIRQIAGFV